MTQLDKDFADDLFYVYRYIAQSRFARNTIITFKIPILYKNAAYNVTSLSVDSI